MKYCFVWIVLLISLLGSCADKASQEETDTAPDKTQKEEYPNGTYCARVTYHNPNTGTQNSYTLNVEVENREVVKILWNNGGWLDGTHFSAPTLDEEGTCSFVSDRGYRYGIKIIGEECSDTDFINNEELFESRISLSECASRFKVSEEELANYETEFGQNRSDLITEKDCRNFREYIVAKRRLDEIDRMFDNGHIEGIIGPSEGVQCQLLAVKRKGIYYLMEVGGNLWAISGLMDFNPEISGWQTVSIMEDPSKPERKIYSMRIIDQKPYMYILIDVWKSYCNNQ